MKESQRAMSPYRTGKPDSRAPEASWWRLLGGWWRGVPSKLEARKGRREMKQHVDDRLAFAQLPPMTNEEFRKMRVNAQKSPLQHFDPDLGF